MNTQHSKNKDHGIQSNHFMANRWGNSGNSDRLICLGSKITAVGDCSHESKRHLLLGRKAMTNLDSILKSRDITLLIKVHLVKAMVFPIIMYGCEKVKVKVVQSCQLFAIPWTIQSMEFSRPEYWSGESFTSPGDLPIFPGIEPRCPTLQVDSLPAEPQGKSKNTGIGSLSLLQQIFLTQESNQGLLHCRWILYQLS